MHKTLIYTHLLFRHAPAIEDMNKAPGEACKTKC